MNSEDLSSITETFEERITFTISLAEISGETAMAEYEI